MNDNKNFWERVAKFYHFFVKSNVYAMMSKLLSSYLNKDMQVLEIGCGTGQISFLVADKVKKLIATDFSEEMIKICRKKNDKNIIFQVEDGVNLSFDNHHFDMVIVANVLHIVPNSDKMISEIKRVLKPNGLVFAPIFVNNSRKTNLRLWFIQKIGFKIYQKNTSSDYLNYLKKMGMEIIYSKTIQSKPLDECVVICRINKN